jgi:WD repeat-containing protein 19
MFLYPLRRDKDGAILAVLQDGANSVPLWRASTNEVKDLECNLRDISFISWSKSGPFLAIATAKGNLVIYNR